MGRGKNSNSNSQVAVLSRPGFWALLALMSLVILGVGSFGYKVIRNAFPEMGRLRTYYPWLERARRNERPRIQLRKGVPPGWVSVQAVSPYLIGAVVVSEDWSFFTHDGYDANEMKEALKKDLVEGRFARGASTITQQVVKNVFLEQDKTLWRKFREFVLSVELDQKVSKRRILEIYFNVVEWGDGIYGIGAAAHRYFDKLPADLTPKESAFLAMLLPSPKRYSQSFRDHRLTSYARRTIRNIMRKMVMGKYMAQELYEREDAIQLSFEIPETPDLPPPSTVDEVELPEPSDKTVTEDPEADHAP